jgi:hypothetical protein
MRSLPKSTPGSPAPASFQSIRATQHVSRPEVAVEEDRLALRSGDASQDVVGELQER